MVLPLGFLDFRWFGIGVGGIAWFSWLIGEFGWVECAVRVLLGWFG